MSSYRKPEIQSDLPKITKIKDFAIFSTVVKITMLISSCFNNYSFELLK